MDLRLPFRRLPAAQRGPLHLYLVLLGVVALLVTIFFLALQVNAGIRAYTSGESHWSKGRSEAVIRLDQYISTPSEHAWEEFRNGLAVPLADYHARLRMNQSQYDRQEVAAYLREGGNHPDDVEMMMYLYDWFSWQPHFSEAIAIWAEGDTHILALRYLGEEVHAAHRQEAMTPEQEEIFRERLHGLSHTLSGLEARFSSAVGDAARWAHGVLMFSVILVSVLLVLLGGYMMRRITAQTFEAEERFRLTFEAAPIGIVQIALDGTWIEANRTMGEIFGCSREDLAGRCEEEFLHPMDRHGKEGMVVRMQSANVERLAAERLYRRPDGREVWLKQSVSLMRDLKQRPMHYVSAVQDVTQARQLAEELSHRARHDDLTGLINRYEFDRRLNRLLERTASDGLRCALLYLDLDQFKVINDTCGHSAGDAMLGQIASIIRSCLREQDTLARLGGDEFGILLEGCPPERAEQIAEKVRSRVMSYRFEWEERTFSLGISIGIVPFSGRGGESARLLSAADTACYAAKEAGRNQIRTSHVEDVILRRQQYEMRWLERLQQALLENRFHLVWQPIVPMSHRGETPARQFEVLLRMTDEAGNVILPGTFLPAAERYGQIADVDRRVVALLLDWLNENSEQHDEIDCIFVNVSGASLNNAAFINETRECITGSLFPPEKLCFEITETMAISNLDAATAFMKQMSAFGCRFALDDFGIGASSFAYLNALPVDFVKIDGMFVCDMDRDPVHASIVKCINEVAQSMGKQTIAEFVETDLVREHLRRLGVDHVQGWAVGVPVQPGNTTLAPSDMHSRRSGEGTFR